MDEDESCCNISAGPTRIPESIKKNVIARLTSDKYSILELPDRADDCREMAYEVNILIGKLLQIPSQFKFILLPGGASQMFAMTAFNISSIVEEVHFIDTDYWNKRAQTEFENFVSVSNWQIPEDSPRRCLPKCIEVEHEAVFITSNNTASGTQWPEIPAVKGSCRIVDMTSDIFARLPDYHNIDLIIAGAQKNFGLAGMSLLIVSDDLLEKLSVRDSVLSFKSWFASNGFYNTIPMMQMIFIYEYLIYIERMGGINAVNRLCKTCSSILYDYLDKSNIFFATVDVSSRSIHNVTFAIKEGVSLSYESVLQLSKQNGIVGLKGHPSIGGFRASFYTGSQIEDAKTLVKFLKWIEYGHR